MAIRLRRVDGILVAICAARSIKKPEDIYLDDSAHHALAVKFSDDFRSEGYNLQEVSTDYAMRMEQEESNNPNREWWDSVYRPSSQVILDNSTAASKAVAPVSKDSLHTESDAAMNSPQPAVSAGNASIPAEMNPPTNPPKPTPEKAGNDGLDIPPGLDRRPTPAQPRGRG